MNIGDDQTGGNVNVGHEVNIDKRLRVDVLRVGCQVAQIRLHLVAADTTREG